MDWVYISLAAEASWACRITDELAFHSSWAVHPNLAHIAVSAVPRSDVPECVIFCYPRQPANEQVHPSPCALLIDVIDWFEMTIHVRLSLSFPPFRASCRCCRYPLLCHGLFTVFRLVKKVDGDVPYRPTAEAADAAQVEQDEDDDAIADRRARVRERLRARRAAEAEVLEVEQEDIAK